MSSAFTKNLYCQLSGVQIGTLALTGSSAGVTPYIRNWDAMILRHPIFSLESSRLLAFSRTLWRRHGNEDTSDANKQTLQICFLAVLHSLDSIQQEVPALPPLWVVQANFKAVFSLAFWKFALESERFKFPTYKVSKRNNNLDFRNIKDYLDICFIIKEEYASTVRQRDEAAKIARAERAEKKLRSSWVSPISNRELWSWVQSQLAGTKYENDAAGWMATIFLAKTDKAITQFDKDEITLFDEIIQSECISDNGMMFAVRNRIDEIKKIWSDTKEAFDIDYEDFDLDAELITARSVSKQAESIAEPQRNDYPSNVLYIKAHALWFLQQAQQKKAVESESKKQALPEGSL